MVLRGAAHPNWKGDNVKDPREGRNRAQRILRVPEPCYDCGILGEERHHIDKNPLNNTLENLVWLCVPCHAKRHRAIAICTMPNCGKEHAAHGLCGTHYMQTLRKKWGPQINPNAKFHHMTPEQIRDIQTSSEPAPVIARRLGVTRRTIHNWRNATHSAPPQRP